MTGGLVSAPDPKALTADDAAVDQLMRALFGVEPVDDPSGLRGAPTGTVKSKPYWAPGKRGLD